jgi:hypothetical protein
VMMFLFPLPNISRAPGLPEVPVASSVDGCEAPASRERVQYTKSAICAVSCRESDTYLCHPNEQHWWPRFVHHHQRWIRVAGAREVVGQAVSRLHPRGLAARGLELPRWALAHPTPKQTKS